MSQSPVQGHTVHSQQHRGNVRNDDVFCDVAAVIENLNDEQWIALTGGESDAPRLDYVKMCVGMISRLSGCVYQMYEPFVQILDPSAIHMEESKSPGTADSESRRSPLLRALCVDILQECKGACLVAIKKIASSGSFTGSGDGLMAQCVRLKEETKKIFYSTLKALVISGEKPNASRFSDKRELTALELNEVTQQLVAAIFAVMENSCHSRESAKAASHLSHVVARMVKVLVSPKADKNKFSLGSFYSAFKQVPPIRLTSAFVGKVHKTILIVLLRSVGSQSIPTPRENAVLSYLSTVWSIVADITDTVLEVLVPVTEERFCSHITKMFSRLQHKVQQFVILGRRNGLTEPDSGADDPSGVPCKSSQGMETCATAAAIAKELNDDGGEIVARLKALIASGQIHKFSLDLRNRVSRLLETSTCHQRVSCLSADQSVPDADLPSLRRDSGADSRSVSLEFAYMFAEESVKRFLHQLLYPSCPSKVSDPGCFIQSSPSSHPCMAMAAYENCSGDICPSHTLHETVNSFKEFIMDQVMDSFSPEEVSTYASSNTEDEAGASTCFEMTDISDGESTSENTIKMSLKQEPCTLPKRKLPKMSILKKYFSKRRNAVSPLAPNQACALDNGPLMPNNLQNMTFTSPEVICSNGSEASASVSQQVDNTCGPDAAEKPKKHIFARFFLSIAKSLRRCIRNSEN